MPRLLMCTMALATALGVAGCKIVVHDDSETTAIAADASGDDARTAQRIADTFDTRLLPAIRDGALDVADLRAALAAGLDAAGEKHANRGSGAGAAWNFPVKGSGKVVETKLDSRARWIALDTDADGSGDMTVQLGPVIKGNALRDVAAFYNFDDFRDQIEFAKLGRALNDRISGMIKVPEGDLMGRTVSFVGVVPLKSVDDAYLVTPIDVAVTP